MSIYSARRAVPALLWPKADQTMWASLFREGDIIDGSGALSHLRPATRDIYEKNYGFWLGYLLEIGVDLISEEDPAIRVTLNRLRGFRDAIAPLAATTKHQRFASLLQVMQRAEPDRDWSILRRAVARLQQQAKRTLTTDTDNRVASSIDLAELGWNLIARANAVSSGLERLLLHRDGVMILFLAYHPIRSRNFGTLRLGDTFLTNGKGFNIAISPTEAKGNRAIEFQVAEALVEPTTEYLDVTRPALLACGTQQTNNVWLNRYGKVWAYRKISERIAAVTKRETGTSRSAHAFRHAAATTLVTASPAEARLSRGLLAHASFGISENHYQHARHIEAARAWAHTLDALVERESPSNHRRPVKPSH